MYPVLFEVFGFEVRSYGLMLMIGIALAVWWSMRRASHWGLEPDKVLDGAFWGIVPGILGARIGFIVQEWDDYSQNPEELWSLKFEGLTSFGGVLFALLGLYVFTRRAKISSLAFLDVVSLPLLVAHSIGRVGCLLNGCCYGHKTTAWFGVHAGAIQGLFQPAQVYESFYVLAGVCVLWWFERMKRPLGQSFALAIVLWGVARFFYEFSRAGSDLEVASGQATSTYWGSMPVTQAQVAALVMVALGGLAFWWVARRARLVATEAAG